MYVFYGTAPDIGNKTNKPYDDRVCTSSTLISISHYQQNVKMVLYQLIIL